MYLPHKAILTICVMTEIAKTAGRVSATVIAERIGVPHRHMEVVLQALVEEGLLRSFRGPRGGYELAKKAKDVTFLDLVRVTRATSKAEPRTLSVEAHEKSIGHLVRNASHAFEDNLSKLTLADVLKATP